MAWEIERKYLVDVCHWQPRSAGVLYRQGYLSREQGGCVRVRIAGDAAILTVKGPVEGIRRLEFEYPVPVSDAELMLERLCGGRIIEKTRHREFHDGRAWEIDVFHADNQGLVVAEIELQAIRSRFAVPSWALREVSADPRYGNSHLATHPFKLWQPALA